MLNILTGSRWHLHVQHSYTWGKLCLFNNMASYPTAKNLIKTKLAFKLINKKVENGFWANGMNSMLKGLSLSMCTGSTHSEKQAS